MSTTEAAVGDYVIRRLQPRDAAGVVDCVRQVYGDSYIIHTELYHPEQIVELNESGRLISVVALDPQNRLVAHYALERPDPRMSAVESGEAMVLPEHRHHHLLEKMRVLLEEEAHRLGVSGIFGRTVTNHLFSQKVVEHFGEKPCGVSLGRTPRTFQNMREPLAQRMSVVFYFKYLKPTASRPLHVPERHQDICARIYQQLGDIIEWREPEPADGQGQHTVEFHPELQRAIIQVQRFGRNTVSALRQAHRDLCREGMEVIYIELPLSEPGTTDACQAAEEDKYFFSGVAPLYIAGRDALRLQYLNVELDTSLLQIENSFARELLAYVDAERQKSNGTAQA